MSCTRTWPLARRSATAATISLLLCVHEPTARIKSPSESRVRGFRICRNWRFCFICWRFLLGAGAMPLVIVNIFSIVAGLVIQCLSTLELTVEGHFCSILKHECSALQRTTASGGRVNMRRLPKLATVNPPCGTVIPCRPICARGVINRCAFCPSELQRRCKDK